MYERHAESAPAAAGAPAARGAIGRWLRARGVRWDSGETQQLAAYAMILTAIIVLAFNPPPGPSWRFWLAQALLLALLGLNLRVEQVKHALAGQLSAGRFVALNTLLIFSAIWFGLASNTFLPYLLFMLTSQACLLLRLRWALLLSAALLLGWIGVLWLKGADLEAVVGNLILVGLGMIFSIVFSLANLRARRQQRRAEALLDELRLVNAELTTAREREKELAAAEERVRLARDIHDGLGHHLTVLNVQLQAATKLVARDPGRAQAALDICREEAQAALSEVRQSVAALRRTPLDGRSLDEALALLVGDFERRAGLSARYSLRGTPVALSPAATTTLYRAAQEGLTNAQKHARARQVTATLSFDATLARLQVCDDGAPAVSDSATTGGFGLAGLRERAEQLGGRLIAAPQPERGFLLDLSLPIERNRDDSHRAGR